MLDVRRKRDAGKSYASLGYLFKERNRLLELIQHHEDKIINEFNKLLKSSDFYFEVHDIILEIVLCKGINNDAYSCNALCIIFEPVCEAALGRLAQHMSNIIKSEGFACKNINVVANNKLRIRF